jgi:Flp pilus assembly protein TadB
VPLIVIGLVVGLFLLGRVLVQNEAAPSITVGSNDPEADCKKACDQFQARRRERCQADRDSASAKDIADATRADFWGAMGALGAALGVLAAFFAVPVLVFLVPAAIAAVAVAAAAVTYMSGRLTAANEDWARKARLARDAFTAELQARDRVVGACGGAARECLEQPSPC